MGKEILKGRFEKDTDILAHRFNSSIGVDFRLYKEDITGSIAHVKMLFRQKIISESDYLKIKEELKNILKDIEDGNLKIDFNSEDIHMFIESELINRIGVVGKKLHTARSRNDQIALDVKLFTKNATQKLIKELFEIEDVLIQVAKENLNSLMPGYTHLQIAQPVTFAHHIMAYSQMFKRDISRLIDSIKRMDSSPLGACALATTTYDIDRFFTAEELGFSGPTLNSIDSVSDRDHVLDLLFNISLIMMHASRLSEEIIIYSSQEFNFISLDESYSTGSSIMPQKKNPDMAELIRAKCAKSYGNLMGALTMLKGIPLSYNKDLQEDKTYLFDSLELVNISINVFKGMLQTLKVNKDVIRDTAHKGFINATDAADYLVKKGIAFRDAYTIVAKIVKYCIDNNKNLLDLTIEEYKTFSDKFNKDIYEKLDLDYILSKRNIFGGPAPESVAEQIKLTVEELEELKSKN